MPSKREAITKRRAVPRSTGDDDDLPLDEHPVFAVTPTCTLAHNYDPESAVMGRPGGGFALPEHAQVCPACEVRVACRPWDREAVARLVLEGFRYAGQREETLSALLGICRDCAERLACGESVQAPGISMWPTVPSRDARS